MRFLFFLLANALLFIRPSEFITDLHGVELYRYAIMAALVVSLPLVVDQLMRRYAGVPPIVGCVLGLLPAVVLSNILGGNTDMVLDNATEMFKVLIYFALMLALLTSVAELRRFLYWFSVFAVVLGGVAVLRYHADVATPQVQVEDEGPKRKANSSFVVDHMRDPNTGQQIVVQRMCGTGIFNDPNDLAVALVSALPLCLFWITDPQRRYCRPLWIVAAVVCVYALMMTHSRGGFLALMAGLAMFLHTRFGGRRTLLIGLILLPVLLGVFAGRMTSLSTSDGTGQSRIQLWSDYLQYFIHAPLFGIGMGNYHTVSSHVAHNSYIHCYAELGIVGGTLFVGAFYSALLGLYQLRSARDGTPLDEEPYLDPELHRLYPYVLAVVVSFAVGMMFLTLSYVVPTFMVLGLATVYLRLHSAQTATVRLNWNRLVLPQLAGASMSFLFVSYTFVRLFVHW
jgi:hypothetical protein